VPTHRPYHHCYGPKQGILWCCNCCNCHSNCCNCHCNYYNCHCKCHFNCLAPDVATAMLVGTQCALSSWKVQVTSLVSAWSSFVGQLFALLNSHRMPPHPHPLITTNIFLNDCSLSYYYKNYTSFVVPLLGLLFSTSVALLSTPVKGLLLLKVFDIY